MIQYPSVAITGQTVTTQISAYPDTRSIVIYNESPYFLQVSLVGSGTYGLAAYTADAFPVFSGFTGSITINPTQYIAIQSGSIPASIMFVQAYGSNEQVSKLIAANSPTGYPLNLSRLQNIGNGSQVSGNASSIINDGNVAGTSIVESTVQGDTGSAVSLTNDGVFKIGTNAHHGSVSFDNGTITSDGNGNITLSKAAGAAIVGSNGLHVANNSWQLLGDNGGTTYLGNGIVDTYIDTNSNIKCQHNGVQDLLVTDNGSGIQLGRSIAGDAIDQTSGDIFFKAINGGFSFQSPNGTTRASFKALNFGQVSGTNATVTHNLGGTPTAVLVIPIIAQAGSATVGVGNVGATTFEATVGAGTGFYWFAIR